MLVLSLREEILLANRLAMRRGHWLEAARQVGSGAQDLVDLVGVGTHHDCDLDARSRSI